jgi:hypothetical protein
MPYSHFDAATALLLEQAFEAAWFTLPNRVRWSQLRQADTIALMTRQIVAAADSGERDHDRLMKAALEGI